MKKRLIKELTLSELHKLIFIFEDVQDRTSLSINPIQHEDAYKVWDDLCSELNRRTQ